MNEKYKEKSRKTFNEVASEFDEKDHKISSRAKEFIFRKMIVRDKDKVLDVACGTGTLLKRISKDIHIEGYGIDIAENMIKIAKEKCPDMTFKVADSENIPFSDEYFDVMTVSAAYHHFPDVDSFAKEANRVMKEAGLLYIADPYYSNLKGKLINKLLPLSHSGDVKFYTPQEIVDNFEDNNFVCKKVLHKDNIQLLIFKKFETVD